VEFNYEQIWHVESRKIQGTSGLRFRDMDKDEVTKSNGGRRYWQEFYQSVSAPNGDFVLTLFLLEGANITSIW